MIPLQILGLLLPPLALEFHLHLVNRPHPLAEFLQIPLHVVVDADGPLLDLLASIPLSSFAALVVLRLRAVDEVFERLLLVG